MIQADFHQGELIFKRPGKQCTYNALASLIKSVNLPAYSWKTCDLNTILHNGDWLCSNSKVGDFPLVSDLPKIVFLEGIEYHNTTNNSMYGALYTNQDEMKDSIVMLIDDAVNLVDRYAVLTLGSNTPAYSVGLIKKPKSFHLFDSHSRGERGMCSASGKATLSTFPNVTSLS